MFASRATRQPNQTVLAEKTSTHMAVVPAASDGANMPAMDTPITACAMSASRRARVRGRNERTNRTTQ